MFETNLSGHNKIWGGPKNFGALPPIALLWLRAWFFERMCGSTRTKYIAL